MVRRVLSILLCGCLLATSLPVTGIAAEEQAVSAMEETVNDAGGGITIRPRRLRRRQDGQILRKRKLPKGRKPFRRPKRRRENRKQRRQQERTRRRSRKRRQSQKQYRQRRKQRQTR